MPHKLSSVKLENLLFNNVRTDFRDLEALRLLGESLKIHQIHPIIVQPNGLVLDGERRVRAARLVGITELLAVVTDDLLTDAQIRQIQFASAFHRADLTPWDKAKAMGSMKADNPEWSHKQLADSVSIDPSMVPRLLAVFTCIPAVQDAMKAGDIGLKAVYEISKESQTEQTALLARALDSGAEGVTRERRRHRSGNGATATAVKVTKIRCPLPSGVQITASGDGLGMDELVNALGEALRAAKRAQADGLDARTFANVLRDRSRNGH